MQIRTLAVGLITGAFLIMKLSISFSNWILAVSPVFAYQAVIRTMSETSALLIGAGVIIPAAYVIFCLGVGLALSGIAYPLLENLFFIASKGVTKMIIDLVHLPYPFL